MKKVILLIGFIALVAISCVNDIEEYPPFSFNNNSPSDSLLINLEYGKGIIVNNSITVEFFDVTADSRCPMDAMCIWPGDAEVILKLTNGSKSEEIKLHTFLQPSFYRFGDYLIQLKSMAPYPISTHKIEKEEYKAEIVIKSSSAKTPIRDARVISSENQSLIKKDLLNINSAMIFNNDIIFDVSYSGGCKTHIIELFAFDYINKSNPPGVVLQLSHNAQNDMCEAYLSEKISFSLANLKAHLKNNFNISDKVILTILDPSGRTIRDGNIEYNIK
jgi:hypothetical protein